MAALSEDLGPLFAWQGRGDAYRAFVKAFTDYRAAVDRRNCRQIHEAHERLAKAQRRRLEMGV